MSDPDLVEAELREYLNDCLGIEAGKLDEDLFQAGLDSLQAIELLAFVEERFAIKVPPARVTREGLSTLRQLVALIVELGGRV